MNLIEITRDAIESVDKKKNEERNKDAFYVSDAGRCRRQMYYSLEFKRPLELNSAEAILRMDAGKRIEESLIDMWDKAGMLVDEQVRVEHKLADGHELHGYADAIVKIGDDDVLVEVKSFYGYYQLKELREGRPNENYVYQLALYMHFLGHDHGKLFYVDRSDMSMFEFNVYLDNGKIGYMTTKGIVSPQEYVNVEDLLADMRFVSNELMSGGDAVPEPDYEYKYDIVRFAEEVKGMSKTNLDKEVKKFRPIDQIKVKDEQGKNRIKYVYNGEIYPKKDHAIDAFNNDVKNGILPQIDSVCGNYQCKYCDYKSHCLESRGISLGYTIDEFKDRLYVLLVAKGEK